MADRSERDCARLRHRHRFQQVLELLDAADFLDETEEFIEAGEAANDLDRLGHRFDLADGKDAVQ